MTDSSALLANTLAVSDTVLYSLKPSSARGRSYKASVAPINASTFNPSSQAIFMIPCGRKNTYLDVNQSFIKFTVQNLDTSANYIYTDNNASCFINRVDIFHSGAMLETIQNYNLVYTYLMDFQLNPAQRVGFANMFGFSPTSNTLGQTRQGAPIYGGQRDTFCMPLLSGLIGLGADKSVPVGMLHDDIRVEISWESQQVACCCSTNSPTLGWQILFAELELTYIELQDEAQSLVDNMTHGQIFLHGNSWRHYVSNLPASTTGVFSTLVPARMASIKSLICLPRRSTEMVLYNAFSLSSRINPCIASYWWRVGSVLIPSRPVTLWNQTLNN